MVAHSVVLVGTELAGLNLYPTGTTNSSTGLLTPKVSEALIIKSQNVLGL